MGRRELQHSMHDCSPSYDSLVSSGHPPHAVGQKLPCNRTCKEKRITFGSIQDLYCNGARGNEVTLK